MNSELISRLAPVPFPPSVLERLASVGREPINLRRSLAHAPAMLAPLLDLIHAVRYDAVVPRRYRELLICRIAQLEDSAYELAHHLPMARAAGVTDEQLATLADWCAADCFTAVERTVLGYAEHLGAGAERDDASLDAHFDPAEQTELTVAGATYLAIARILRALDVQVDHGLS